MCVGHFFGKDEDVYTFFEPELPPDNLGLSRSKVSDAVKPSAAKRQAPPPSTNSSSRPQTQSKSRPNADKKSTSSGRSSPENTCWNVLDLKKDNYFSVAVGRTRTNARYLLNTSDDVVAFLKGLAEAACFSSH